jgi:hypothetical protein
MDVDEHPHRYLIRCYVCGAKIGYDDTDDEQGDVCDDCNDKEW